MTSDETFRILTICTGNVCRSPAAELILGDAVRRVGADDVDITSAGTRPLEGQGVDPEMARLLVADGIDVEGFVARRLTAGMVRDADLVLGLTREHRSAAVQLRPAALRQAFTLLELARLVARVEPGEVEAVAGPEVSFADRLRALAQLAPRHRSVVAAELEDIEDPYRRGPEAFARVHARIAEAVEIIVDAAARR
ncbi:low molecular weight phosphatase family protein [Janibacter indicus]|uniref:arsenate reductase/protein-tyrosine-phosphatase family protein n=1 Tax=Janibacter indicus TaxID=857417 RepID=UPI003EB75FFB